MFSAVLLRIASSQIAGRPRPGPEGRRARRFPVRLEPDIGSYRAGSGPLTASAIAETKI